MYMSFRCLNLSFISLKLCNEVSAGLGCFCLCFFCADLLLLPLKVSGNSVTDSSGNESVSKWNIHPVFSPHPQIFYSDNYLNMTPDPTTVWNTHGRVCVLFNYIMNETSGKILKTWEDIFLMLKTLDEFSKPRLNWLFYLNLNNPITISLF